MVRRRQAKKFKVGERIVYPSHGVGKIKSIESMDVAGVSTEMFVILVERDKLTLYVPINKARDNGMRSLSTLEVVEKAMNTLRGKPVQKKLMWSRKAQEYNHKINSGDIIQIAEVVRDLHRYDEQKEQSYSERQLFESAFDRLGREVAHVNGVSQKVASEEMQLVLISRKK